MSGSLPANHRMKAWSVRLILSLKNHRSRPLPAPPLAKAGQPNRVRGLQFQSFQNIRRRPCHRFDAMQHHMASVRLSSCASNGSPTVKQVADRKTDTAVPDEKGRTVFVQPWRTAYDSVTEKVSKSRRGKFASSRSRTRQASTFSSIPPPAARRKPAVMKCSRVRSFG